MPSLALPEISLPVPDAVPPTPIGLFRPHRYPSAVALGESAGDEDANAFVAVSMSANANACQSARQAERDAARIEAEMRSGGPVLARLHAGRTSKAKPNPYRRLRARDSPKVHGEIVTM